MPTRDQIEQALRTVVDPEVGINVVDLGLVYGVDVEGTRVRVKLTMTSPTCPLGEHVRDQTARAIRKQVQDVGEVEITLVREPPWHPGLMTEAAKRMLNWGE